jgi:hypothetical protein
MISCICLAQRYGEDLASSVESFIKQNYDGERELIIFSTNPKVHLVFAHPNVIVANVPRACLPCDARNTAIGSIAKGDKIVIWNEDDYYLPNHLQNIASHFDGNDFVWLERQFDLERGKIERIGHGSAATFAFTKKAWERTGKYQRGFLNERNFIGRLTKISTGKKVPMTPDTISFIRCGSDMEKRTARTMFKPGQLILEPVAKRDYVAMAKQFVTGKTENKIAVVELGRYGDIINILPYLKLIHENYAMPHLVIAKEFESILEGVTYVKPFVVNLKNEDLKQAIDIAKRDFQIVINTQIWGKGHVQIRKCDSYNRESWRMAGLLEQFHNPALIPVFDRRNKEREDELLSAVQQTGKPMLLVNLGGGVSSPCPACPTLMDAIVERWGQQFNIVDLSKLKGHRIYDFLGIFEKSAALVSIDTSWLHLSAATNIPVVALINPKEWAGTVVRFNCVDRIGYDKAVAEPELVHKAIVKATEKKPQQINESLFIVRAPVERKVWHAVDRFEDTDPKIIERKRMVQASWDLLYESGQLMPAHFWKYPRNAKETINDPRRLPYLKDILKNAIDQMDDGDICLWTNDDNIIHPRLPEYLKFHVSIYGACSMFRTEFRGNIASLDLSPENFAKAGTGKHIGRDGFAFTKEWLVKNWDALGDVILGASDWDIYLAAFIRLQHGIRTTNANLGDQIFPAEIPNGYTGHIAHHSQWNTPDVNKVPSNVWNRAIFRTWAADRLPELKFTAQNTLGV